MKHFIVQILLLLSVPLGAEPLDQVTLGNPLCFTRQYTRDHLAAHPRQTVESMFVKLYRQNNPGDQMIYLDLKARIRGRRYSTMMICDPSRGPGLRCSIECDGGHADLKAAAGGGLVLFNHGFVVYGGCDGEGEPLWLTNQPGGDDVFYLQPRACQ